MNIVVKGTDTIKTSSKWTVVDFSSLTEVFNRFSGATIVLRGDIGRLHVQLIGNVVHYFANKKLHPNINWQEQESKQTRFSTKHQKQSKIFANYRFLQKKNFVLTFVAFPCKSLVIIFTHFTKNFFLKSEFF